MAEDERKRLKQMRILAELSLDEVGKRIGVSGSFLSRFERDYANLTPAKETKLANVLREAMGRVVMYKEEQR